MATDQPNLIIKKVKKGGDGGHHGGAWKVAYADFVTAMMAFFMLMWLLNATTEEQRSGIADYFSQQLPISETSAGGSSMFNGDTIFVSKQLTSHGQGGAETDEKGEFDPASSEKPPEEIAAEVLAVPEIKVEIEKQLETLETLEAEETAMAEERDRKMDDEGDLDPEALTDEELEAAETEKRDREVRRISRAFAELEEMEDGNALLKHLSMRMTPDGLMIEITETAGDPLFATGSAKPSEMMRELIAVVAPIVAELENRIAIVGHTDARQYSATSRYTNWDLSADRANAARRLLTEFGLPQTRIARITGAADREPLSGDAFAPENRRIGITLLREPSKRTRPDNQ